MMGAFPVGLNHQPLPPPTPPPEANTCDFWPSLGRAHICLAPLAAGNILRASPACQNRFFFWGGGVQKFCLTHRRLLCSWQCYRLSCCLGSEADLRVDRVR